MRETAIFYLAGTVLAIYAAYVVLGPLVTAINNAITGVAATIGGK